MTFSVLCCNMKADVLLSKFEDFAATISNGKRQHGKLRIVIALDENNTVVSAHVFDVKRIIRTLNREFAISF